MAQSALAIPKTLDLVVVGAGPHALTLVTHLIQKCKKMRDRLLVFDPSGVWMNHWHHQFAALEIPHLRSPAVHHPDPNPYALRRFAESRLDELYAPYDLPGSRLFQEFCQNIVKCWQLDHHVIPTGIVRIQPLRGKKQYPFGLELQDGRSLMARRVILATGSHHPHMPDWVNQIPPGYPIERLCHSSQIDLRQIYLTGERILIVGGGLTSGHLALGAIARGAEVVLMHRRKFCEKLFDADPGWLGPKYLKAFWNEPNWHTRWQMIQDARHGGSITPAIMTKLHRAHHANQLTFQEHCQVVKAHWQGQHWQVQCTDGSKPLFDRIWLATGTQIDVSKHPLLQEIQDVYPTPSVNGLPLLDEHLRWRGCELFVMGGLAALRVGPTARNLSGARMACDYIVPALAKASVGQSNSAMPILVSRLRCQDTATFQ